MYKNPPYITPSRHAMVTNISNLILNFGKNSFKIVLCLSLVEGLESAKLGPGSFSGL